MQQRLSALAVVQPPGPRAVILGRYGVENGAVWMCHEVRDANRKAYNRRYWAENITGNREALNERKRNARRARKAAERERQGK